MITNIKTKLSELISDKSFVEILSGSIWTLVAKVGGTLVALTTTMLVAQNYGAEIVGILAIVQTFLMMVTIAALMGTDTAILRLIPEHVGSFSYKSAFMVYRKSLILVAAMSLILSALFIAGSEIIAETFFSKEHLNIYIILAASCIIFKSTADLSIQSLRGLRSIRIFAIFQAMPQTIMLILLFIIPFLWDHDSVPIYAYLGGVILTALVGLTVSNAVFGKKIQHPSHVKAMDWRSIIVFSSPMMLTVSMGFFISQTGILLLGVYSSEADVGYYFIAVKLATLTVFILQAVNSIAAPKFADLYHKNKLEELFKAANQSARIIFWASLPIILILLLWGKAIIGTAFGDEFVVGYPAMVVLIFGQAINAAAGSTGFFMNMTGQHKALGFIMTIAAFLNLGLGFMLIPTWGVMGAAWSAALSLTAWNIAALMCIKYRHGRGIGYLPVPNVRDLFQR